MATPSITSSSVPVKNWSTNSPPSASPTARGERVRRQNSSSRHATTSGGTTRDVTMRCAPALWKSTIGLNA